MTVAELFTNPPTAGVSSPLAQLSVDITTTPAAGTVESYAVSAAAPPALRAASGRFRVLVDHEIMVVTASVSGSSPWEFERGAEGSTPAPHSSGAAIHHVLTAGALATKADLDSGTGLLLDSQTPAAVATTLAGLGSAATHPASDFDPAGAAASAQAAAEAASDPAGAAAAAAAAAQAAAEAASDPAGAAAAAQAAAEAASDPAGSAAAAQAAAIAAAEAASLPVGTTLDQVPGAAADVSLHGHKLTSLAAATAGTDALNRDTGDGRYPQRSATAGGALAPTATRTSTIDVPVLRDFVSIMDFAAKGDAKQVTDATIASGTNQLHSTSAAFTTAANVGQQVNVVGAGTASGVLTAYIGSVSGGVASLVTTHGGSTPANASTTISSGGTVNYGTLDTTALQDAINAVSSNGGGVLLLPAGFQFLVGQVIPKGNVTLWCYGATIYMDQTAANGIFYWNVVDLPSGNLARWQIRGGVWTGTGKETNVQFIFFSQTAATCSDVRFIDMHVTNWTTGPIYIRNPTRARAIDNTLLNCGGSSAYNQINFVASEVAATELIARGNVIDGTGGIPIDVVCGALSSNAAVRYIVAENHVTSNTGPGVSVEWVNATAGAYTDFVMANNTIVQTNTDVNQFALSASSFTQPDPSILGRTIIKGNTIVSATGGLRLNSSDAIVEGNVIQATKLAISCGKGSGGVSTVTATTSNGSPTLTAVSLLTGAPVDGSPVSGTGITGGTFVKSGTGTATWTLSQNATAAGTVTVSVWAQDRNVTIHDNVLRCAKDPGDDVFQVYGLRNSTVSENRVIVASGTTTSTFSGMTFIRCGWMDIHHNHVEYAPKHGIAFDGNDFDLHHNRVYNCSEDAAGYVGIMVQSISGTVANVTENTIIDDRSSHKMLYGLDASFQTNNQVLAARNHMRGYTASRSINGQCAPGSIDNDDDQNPGGARVIQVNATNASFPIPAGATLVRITVVGGGGGGGGGGAAGSGAPTATQVGGSGGAAGGFASMVIPVGASTTINFTIGAKGTGGAGAVAGDGTAGKAGTNGNSGGATTAALGASTVYAGGGFRGGAAAANSATGISGLAWETPWGVGDSHAKAGGGGSSSSTNGENGGNPFGYVGGGGQGGSPASATNGGLGGGAGLRSNATSTVGGGTAPTPAGTNGGSATANTGAGGGGGGGGSYNSGVTPGIGGTGGDGATGYALLEVLA